MDAPNSAVTTVDATEPTHVAQRRYDVDCLRVLALGLLIIYHVVISFQPWAQTIFFLQNEQSLPWLWIFMSMFNVWRIPILFLISGMGVRFALERRNWKQLLADRSVRILIPLVFGIFTVCPLFLIFTMKYYNQPVAYWPNLGHLWFLANIYVYVLLSLPLLAYLKNGQDNFVNAIAGRAMTWPASLLILALPLMLESWLLTPEYFPMFAQTWHGFWLGAICFFAGFIFVSQREVFWHAVKQIRYLSFTITATLFLIRLFVYELESEPNSLVALECASGMLAALGFSAKYLNHESKILAYLSQAVFPIYILHMPIQFAFSYYLFPIEMPALAKFILLTTATFGGSFLLYELAIKRVKWLRPLFGMKL